MKPREALLMIPGFAHANVLDQLADGVTSASWLVEGPDGQYVLRIDTPEARALGLDRAAESEAQSAVARAGLTPAAVFHNIDHGVSLRPHVPGRTWTVAELRRGGNLGRLGRLLRDLHSVPPEGAHFEPGLAARRYARQIGTPHAQQLADRANVLLAELRDPPARECLCHNDLVAENLVDDGDCLVPIDWEFAGIGDALFDLAVVAEHHGLPPAARGRLLKAYFGRDATPAEAQRVQSWSRFYTMLLQLWEQRIA